MAIGAGSTRLGQGTPFVSSATASLAGTCLRRRSTRTAIAATSRIATTTAIAIGSALPVSATFVESGGTDVATEVTTDVVRPGDVDVVTRSPDVVLARVVVGVAGDELGDVDVEAAELVAVVWSVVGTIWMVSERDPAQPAESVAVIVIG